MNESTAQTLERLLSEAVTTSAGLQAVIEWYSRAINAERCCLFLRHPVSRMSRMTHEWVSDDKFRINRDSSVWEREAATLETEDPMFAEALARPDALYIDDVRSADPNLVNAKFEERCFGHRALVHAPLYFEDLMYGILEPCVFEQPRRWSESDQSLTAAIQPRLAEAAASFVIQDCPS